MRLCFTCYLRVAETFHSDIPLNISFNDVFQIIQLRWFRETEAFGTATHFFQSFCLRLSSAYNAFGKRVPEQDCGGAVILQASGSVDWPMCSKPKQMFYKSAVASGIFFFFFCAGNNTIYKLITNANWITRLVLFFLGEMCPWRTVILKHFQPATYSTIVIFEALQLIVFAFCFVITMPSLYTCLLTCSWEEQWHSTRTFFLYSCCNMIIPHNAFTLQAVHLIPLHSMSCTVLISNYVEFFFFLSLHFVWCCSYFAPEFPLKNQYSTHVLLFPACSHSSH